MPTTQIAITPAVQAFADKCRNLDGDGIYKLFEHKSSQRTRDAVYAHSDDDTPEPFRSACINLGNRLQIQSLINF